MFPLQNGHWVIFLFPHPLCWFRRVASSCASGVLWDQLPAVAVPSARNGAACSWGELSSCSR